MAFNEDPKVPSVTVNEEAGVSSLFVADCTTAAEPFVPPVSTPEKESINQAAPVCV